MCHTCQTTADRGQPCPQTEAYYDYLDWCREFETEPLDKDAWLVMLNAARAKSAAIRARGLSDAITAGGAF